MTLRTPAALLFAAAVALPQDSGRTVLVAPNLVDRILGPKWDELHLKPNRPAADEEFLRRVTLDLVGTLPEPREVIAFAAATGPKKREQKIDALLAHADWSHYWAERLTAIFLGYENRNKLRSEPAQMESLLRSRLTKNDPYNQIVRDLLSAQGSSKSPETSFLVSWLYKDKTKRNLAVQISRVFMGIQLQCAQCHDHPFDKWTKDDFYGIVANFAGLTERVVNKGKAKADQEVEVTDDPRAAARYRPEGYKAALSPKFFDGSGVAGESPRAEFVKKLVSADNSQFARATVNRFWSMFFGQGLLEPVDDFSAKNSPALPELLEGLAQEFAKQNFDLKWLMRTIVSSRAYQLSSRRRPKDFPDESLKYFVTMRVRPMSPEQTLGALLAAQGESEGDMAKPEKGKKGAKAGKLQSPRQFFREMAESAGDAAPGEYSASVTQVMKMLNIDSPLYHGTRASGGGRMSEILRETKDPAQIVLRIYLSALSRRPTSAEVQEAIAYYSSRGSNLTAFEDLFFVLLNSNEFFFNH